MRGALILDIQLITSAEAVEMRRTKRRRLTPAGYMPGSFKKEKEVLMRLLHRRSEETVKDWHWQLNPFHQLLRTVSRLRDRG